MKLRNKETGIIGELHFDPNKEYHFTVATEDPADVMIYKKLADLYAEWEDYEEPETYYYISDLGKIESLTNDYGQNLPEEIWHKAIKCRKEIDNYFETKEEAEKAAEKLKALTRLRNNNLRLSRGSMTFVNTDEVFTTMNVRVKVDTYPDVEEDLDLLFGGEE